MTTLGDTDRQRVFLVVGGAGGIGEATATYAAARGGMVAIGDRAVESAVRVAAELGSRAIGIGCDVLDTESIENAVERTAAEFGGIDVLVNCAGLAAPGASADLSDAEWKELTAVHVTGTMRCARAAYPVLRESESAAIVNLSSMNSRIGVSGRLSYSASKGAIEAMTRVLAVEWADDGIRVNAIAPGYVMTSMVRNVIEDGHLDEGQMIARVPLGRLAVPAEIAAVIHFVASSEASYLTGQTIVVDGGRIVNGDL